MEIFPIRQAIERLRAGLFDPVALEHLMIKEEPIMETFSRDLKTLEKGKSTHLCICGSYGQGKSHNLHYLQKQALSLGYATSLCQLDIREIPFYHFPTVYQSLLNNLCLPTGESFFAAWKTSPVKIPEDMPHRFQMILQAMIAKNDPTAKKTKLKTRLKPHDFDPWLEKAFMGNSLPLSHLKHILKTRKIDSHKEHFKLPRGNAVYIQTLHSLGEILHRMGYKGLLLFFDEAEAIAQGRLQSRAKSYESLNQLFQFNGFVYPIFAFTDTFFERVRSENYDYEMTPFAQNYAELWKNLKIVRLQELSLARWETLLDRLIKLYTEAYQINLSEKTLEMKNQMRELLSKLQGQETRYKLKALINQIDLVSFRTAS